MPTDKLPKIPALPASATKAEEIRFLEAIHIAVMPGTFLADLFTPELLEFVINRVRRLDAPPNVMQDLARALKAELDAGGRAARAEADMKMAQNAMAAMHLTLTEELAAKDFEIERINKGQRVTWNRNNELTEAVATLQQEKLGLAQLADGFEAKAAELELEVLKLKARILDLLDGRP